MNTLVQNFGPLITIIGAGLITVLITYLVVDNVRDRQAARRERHATNIHLMPPAALRAEGEVVVTLRNQITNVRWAINY